MTEQSTSTEQPTPKRTPRKPAAKRSTSTAKRKPATKAKRAAVKLSTDSDTIPRDVAELRKLIKITRDRRWRAGRRGDAELVAAMQAKLDTLTSELATRTSG